MLRFKPCLPHSAILSSMPKSRRSWPAKFCRHPLERHCIDVMTCRTGQTIGRIRRALEAAGIEFIEQDGRTAPAFDCASRYDCDLTQTTVRENHLNAMQFASAIACQQGPSQVPAQKEASGWTQKQSASSQIRNIPELFEPLPSPDANDRHRQNPDNRRDGDIRR